MLLPEGGGGSAQASARQGFRVPAPPLPCEIKHKHPPSWYKLYGEQGCLDLMSLRIALRLSSAAILPGTDNVHTATRWSVSADGGIYPDAQARKRDHVLPL